MLSREQAQTVLESLKRNDWVDARVRAARQLPPHIRALAYALLQRDAQGKELTGEARHTQWSRIQQEVLPLLDVLDETELRALISTLFGSQLVSHVEQGYRLHYRLPYQTGYYRKAFRAPNERAATRHARFSWLSYLVSVTGPYDQSIQWFAAWAPHLGWRQDTLGILFAGVIDGGGPVGDEVFDILVASARGEHEVGAMGRHVSRALLAASRHDGWEFIERLLLAAQRQEGLRQVILETVDEAHPQAFRRMLRLILDQDLIRFAATVRAVDVWFGLAWETAGARVVNATLARLLDLLEDPSAAAGVLAGEEAEPEMLYLALWAIAFEDAPAAVSPASGLLSSPRVERRFVGAHLLAQLGLDEGYKALVPALDDIDLRVAVRAFDALAPRAVQPGEPGLFEAFERLLLRLPGKERQLEPLVWPWMALVAEKQSVARALVTHLDKRSPKRLIPYMSSMEGWHRAQVVELLMEREKGDAEARDTIFSLVGDPSSAVREKALAAVTRFGITPAEALRFETLLTRKAGDLRRGVISLLLGQPDRAAIESVRRLMRSKSGPQRLAGLELLRQLFEAHRCETECHKIAEQYRETHATLDTDEEKLLECFTRRETERVTLDDGLGLFDPEQRTFPAAPSRLKQPVGILSRLFKGGSDARPLVSGNTVALLQDLDEFVHTHREMPVTMQRGGRQEEELLGNITWGLPNPEAGIPADEDAARLPTALREALEDWWRRRLGAVAATNDSVGMEVLRAMAPFQTGYWGTYGFLDAGKKDPTWLQEALKVLYGGFDTRKLRYSGIAHTLLIWLLKLHPPRGSAPDMLLDAVETTFSLVPPKEWDSDDGASLNPWGRGWRDNSRLMGWLSLTRYHRAQYPEQWHARHQIRLWRLLRWLDEPTPGIERLRPDLDITLAAYAAGLSGEAGEVSGPTRADLLDQLIGPRTMRSWGRSFHELYKLSGRKAAPEIARYPWLAEMVERCRHRVVEVELGRGDLPTPASYAALSLRYTGTLDTLARVLSAMGKESFVRGWTYDAISKAAVFSHLVRATFPGAEDTRERFTREMRSARVPEKRLLELSMYAPQWAAHVEHALGWPALEEAVWWLHAHTKDTGWTVDEEVRETWAARTSERTPLSAQSLLDGAVDVAWFGRVYSALSQQRWEQLYSVAQYASGGGGHKRAQLFADAMLGRVGEEDLVARIKGKRQQDAVRALGLLPLPQVDSEEREHDILCRYKVMQEFVRASKQFGSQRQASEKLAASIGLENLARTAGYSDPVRLEWAMEAKAIEDLAQGPLLVTVDGVTLQLGINDWGEADLSVTRDGKPLKNMPPKVKKNPQVAALREREREVAKQARRMRLSLEGAMCRGDEFTGAELRSFFAHPLLRPMVERLVFVVESNGASAGGVGGVAGVAGAPAIGFPVDDGGALLSHDSRRSHLEKGVRVRIAHPYDLLSGGEWHLWQHELFASERVQPFKQVFRELYPLTPAEQAEGNLSRRYEGHQVNPRQALALLGARGWVNDPEEGARRTFHEAGISAWVTFLEGFYTPADVDGLTVEHVRFTRRGEWQSLPLKDIPSRIFSEAMRDLDLVVSVAHRGGVDPEASASTVEMRAALVVETCAMLRLSNVRVQERGQHVLVEGNLGSYSIHLGSGVAHRQPGGALCIIPVHSQHRGRIFLPFADDDPKTAEVLSKVLLLARDTEIKDPTILEQLLLTTR